MRWWRVGALRACMCAILFVSLLLFAADQKKKGFSLVQVPDQWAQLRNVPEVVAAQKCENWAWAAGVETILKKEDVPLDQRFWVDRLNGGALCVDSAASLDALAQAIDGEYVVTDGRKIRLQSRYVAGAPTSIDRMLVPLAMGRPYILWWKQHAYIVDGATWNEYIYPNAQKQIELKEISLLDPFVKGEKRKVKFVAATDSASDIGGMFEVMVTQVDAESRWK